MMVKSRELEYAQFSLSASLRMSLPITLQRCEWRSSGKHQSYSTEYNASQGLAHMADPDRCNHRDLRDATRLSALELAHPL